MKRFWQVRNETSGYELELLVYGSIGDGFWDDVVASWFVEDLARAGDRPVRVRINSVGGDLFGGIAMYNALRQHSGRVTCVVEGLAASAASLVALAGEDVVMRRGAMLMVHAPSAMVHGNADDLRGAADMLDKARDSLVSIYEDRTGRPFDELRELVDAETWMTAAEAVEQGFASSIDEEAPVAVTAREGLIIANTLSFAREDVPDVSALVLEPVNEPAPVTSETPRALTREALAAEAPELLRALLEEGRAEERKRLQAIDELPTSGHAELTAEAKYGAEPMTAEALAASILRAEAKSRSQYLKNRKTDADGANVPPAGAPPAGADDELVAAMTAGVNNRRS